MPADRDARLGAGAGALLIRKLALRSPLTEDDRRILGALVTDEARLNSRVHFVLEGERLSRSILLVEGYAARYKVTAEGNRQIVSLHVPGDLIDLHSAILKVSDHNIAAFGPVRLGYVQHDAILAATDRHPTLARALWRDSLVDAAIEREWLLNVGQKDAFARTAHLFCEVGMRLEAMGLAPRHRFVLPLAQHELADAVGLTAVHVNRTLQRMRSSGLITTHGSELCVDDWDALAEAGDFEPDYLYLPA